LRHTATFSCKNLFYKKEIKKSFNFLGVGYTYEIEEVNNCIRKNKLESSKWNWKNSLDIAILMDNIRKKVGIIYNSDVN
jgi:hypothetical protein